MSKEAMKVNDVISGYSDGAEGQDVPPGYKRTEVGVIPEDWTVKSLGALCFFQNGTALERYFNSYDGYQVISIGNYSAEGKYIDTNTFIGRQYTKKLNNFILIKEDLAILLNDKTSVGTIIGRVLIIDESDKYIFNQRTMRLTPKNLVVPIFLYYQINSEKIHRKIIFAAKPGTQIYINTGDVIGLNVPFPPEKAEQRAIAKALSDADGLLGALDALIAKKRAIKQAAMQQLLTGNTRLPGFSGEMETKQLGDVPPGHKQTKGGVIPEDWGFSGLGEIVTKIGSGVSKTGNLYARYPVYGSTGAIGSSDSPDYEGQAILVARVGANAGKLNVVNGKYGVTDNTIIIKLRSDCCLPFILRQLERKNLNSMIFGSGQPLITGTQLKALTIAKPSISEQTAIATVLSDMDAEITALAQRRDKTHQIKQGMMQQLLTGRIRLVKPKEAA